MFSSGVCFAGFQSQGKALFGIVRQSQKQMTTRFAVSQFPAIILKLPGEHLWMCDLPVLDRFTGMLDDLSCVVPFCVMRVHNVQMIRRSSTFNTTMERYAHNTTASIYYHL